MSYLPTGSYEQDLGDVLDTFKSGLKTGGKAILDTFSTIQQQKGREQAAMEIAKAQAAAAQQRRGGGGMPSWAIPAAIGGGVLLLILLMKKK